MLKNTDMSEKGLQRFIVRYLVETHGYRESSSQDFDFDYCLNRGEFMEFLQKSQPESYQFIINKGEKVFFERLDGAIKRDGIVTVLRKGIKHFDKTIFPFFPHPNSKHNEKDATKWDANIFSVVQELVYSNTHKNRIDLVLFLNGLPLITIELKNAYTHQAVKNAIEQYKKDRNPKDKLLNFARTLVHFAFDTDLVYMTTKLEGFKTQFLPFNKGQNDGKPFAPYGAVNPVNPYGEKTAYMWEEIFAKKSLSSIIDHFVHLEKGNNLNTLIFPRYHQFKVVEELLAKCKEEGIGGKFLIQHSAGSGKSNSIAWLAHQLTGLYDKENTHPLFESVVVVTDRTVLDRQIRETIKSFEHVKNIVEAITGNATDIKRLSPTEQSMSKSTHMRLALENNKRIITCTVQTFPFVVEAVHEMQSKRVAFIIDEAHSSQNGLASASMNALFSGAEIPKALQDSEGTIDTEDLVNFLMESKKMLTNATYFAFTATPKNKTLETFGTRQNDGTFKPFHTYSMKQAIEEEYILDVLENYTTYKTYYKLQVESEEFAEKEYEIKEANKKLRKYVEGHQLAIYEKAKIMIDHFNKNVRHLIESKAKAMVVTKSIESAMKYKDAFDRYLKESGLPYKAIVAFSGKKKHYETGTEMSENDMNRFKEGSVDIPEQFKKDEYKFLIVADKYQTGFDQPLLHTMYVDKELSDVQAVQTLSRLNRAYKPYKRDTMVLDFYNSVEDIKEAFQPFYTTTILSGETDVNKLNDLQSTLDEYQMYSMEDLDNFFRQYYTGSQRDVLGHILDSAVENFETLDKDKKIKFKQTAKNFVRTYGYLSKIMEYNVAIWEKMWIFLKFLVPKLSIPEDTLEENVLEAIDMESYRIAKLGESKITLGGEEGVVEPIPVSQGGGLTEKVYDVLGKIVSEFNSRFGDIDWGSDVDPKEAEKILIQGLPEKLKNNEDFIKSIKNSDKDNAKLSSDDGVKNVMSEMMYTHTRIYQKFMNDEDFKKRYLDFVFDMMWNNAK